MSEFNGLLHDLKEHRAALIGSMIDGKGWSDEQVRQLAELHGAIAAVEAQIAEPPIIKVGPRVEYGVDGYPK